MKAFVLEATDGLQSAVVKDIETPTPKAGEVLVAVKAAALNHRELWITRGQYPGMVPVPFSMGCDGAGVIESVGEGVDERRIGEEVVLYPGLNWGPDPRFPAADFGLLGMPGPGTIAEKIAFRRQARCPSRRIFASSGRRPCARGADGVARLVHQGRLERRVRNLLVTGIGGGVAVIAPAIRRTRSGAQVYVTSGSEDTMAPRHRLGRQGGLQLQGRGLAQSTAQGERRHRHGVRRSARCLVRAIMVAPSTWAPRRDLWLDGRRAIPRQCAGAVSQEYQRHRHQCRQSRGFQDHAWRSWAAPTRAGDRAQLPARRSPRGARLSPGPASIRQDRDHPVAAGMSSLFGLDKKIALVTGGAQGMGRMIAAGLIGAGAKVYITSRKREVCEATALELAKGGACVALTADLDTPEAAARSRRRDESTRAHAGHPDQQCRPYLGRAA